MPTAGKTSDSGTQAKPPEEDEEIK